ncbi:MAG: sugar ABC transporter permease [Chloroflexi bacterium]|nr:MAG: sugar ABC transporter permease [Chloroflexota bacterium]
MAITYDRNTQIEQQSLLDNERVLGSVMLLPAIVYIVALVGLPFFLAIGYSLSDITVGDPSLDFVGFSTFRAVINDGTFQRSLLNTFVFTVVSQLIVIIAANMLALALNKNFRGKWLIRFLLLLPWATPIALGTIGWLWVLDSVFSPIDWLLTQANILGPGGAFGPSAHAYWLGKPTLAMISVITVHVWRLIPLATVILMAGLTAIPQDIRDAVAVDGVGFWREFFEVTLPLLTPIMAVATLFGVIFTFTDMAVVFVLTRGGPVSSTQVLSSWAYFKGIEGGNLAQGAAIALFLLPVLVAVVIAMLRLARRSEVL